MRLAKFRFTRMTEMSAGLLWLVCPVLLFYSAPAFGEAVEPVSADSLLARSERFLEAGRIADAQALYERILSSDSKDHRAECGLAACGLHRGDADFTIDHARRAVKGDRKNSQYHYILGCGYGIKAQRGGLSALFYAGKVKQEFRKAVELDPMNIAAQFGMLYFLMGAPAAMGGGLDRARAKAEEIAVLDRLSGFRARALVAIAGGDDDEAESVYLEASREDSLNPQVWKALGHFYIERDGHARAIRCLERVLLLDPSDLGSVYQLARARLLLGDDLGEAEEGFKRYIAAENRPQAPDLASAHWRLGMVYEKQERYDEAIAHWEAALGLDPDHEKARDSLARFREEHPEWQ